VRFRAALTSAISRKPQLRQQYHVTSEQEPRKACRICAQSVLTAGRYKTGRRDRRRKSPKFVTVLRDLRGIQRADDNDRNALVFDPPMHRDFRNHRIIPRRN
jgi:hypothetical protein